MNQDQTEKKTLFEKEESLQKECCLYFKQFYSIATLNQPETILKRENQARRASSLPGHQQIKPLLATGRSSQQWQLPESERTDCCIHQSRRSRGMVRHKARSIESATVNFHAFGYVIFPRKIAFQAELARSGFICSVAQLLLLCQLSALFLAMF